MIEILDEANEWTIHLPKEDIYINRLLEVRRPDGTVIARWRYQGNSSPMHEGWTVVHGRERFRHAAVGELGRVDTFGKIVKACVDGGWALHSLPEATAVPASPADDRSGT